VKRKLFLRKTEEYEHEESGKLAKLCHKCELYLKKKSMKENEEMKVAKTGGF
jgi:hypothetical protein